MNTPPITILLPVYNAENYLAEAISSILKQTFTNFTLLVIDDGSKDNSPQIIKAISDPRLKYIRNPRNLGLVKTLNRGISLTKSQYIVRMDADDISLPDRLLLQYQFMERHPDIFVCGSWVQIVSLSSQYIWQTPTHHSAIAARLIFESPLAHSSTIIRSALFKKLGLSYESAYPHAEDYRLWVKAAARVKLANLPQVLLKYRVHSQQIGAVFYNTQVQSSQKIRYQLLKNISVNPSPPELYLHQKLSAWKPAVNLSELLSMRDWLKQIHQKSRTQSYCRSSDLLLVLAERWAGICRLSTNAGLIRYWYFFTAVEFVFPSLYLIFARIWRKSK